MEVRPETFKMPIQGGMLEALGINMYTTLGMCLVEFVANAYDSEASKVAVEIPMAEIETARTDVRTKAKAEVASGTRERFGVLLETLPPNIAVTITDDGHGMSWRDVQNKFLPLNRKRRDDGSGHETRTKSETAKRFVMGRKGLGKLAGFGAAEHVRIRTKRAGEDFATVITLEDRLLKSATNLTDVAIPATYVTGLDPAEHGTVITLSGLKSDAVKEKLSTLEDSIREAFHALRPEEFAIELNGAILGPVTPEYEFIHPPERDARDYATASVHIEDVGDVSINYRCGFMPRGQHLPARKRGARVYCNNRLAAGPTLFKLQTGMHSFHSVDYLECIVEADELDRESIDFINTNRTQLREDNEVVRALVDKVTALMTEAIRAHGNFRDAQAKEKLRTDPTGQVLTAIVDTLPRKTRKPATKLLGVLASEYGVESDEFRELAPSFINSVNATDVLVRLMRLQSKPETVAKVAEHLRELGEMERADVLKLYRGRRSGIAGLLALWKQGEEEWRKKGREAELHALLKANPWLIRPEFSNYLTSDQDLNKVVSRVARALDLDTFAKVVDEDKDDATRPDLTFLMSDPSYAGPYVINVVELKSPSLALKMAHYDQLATYVFQIEEWCKAEVSHKVSVRGFLIGAMPAHNATAVDQKRLLQAYEQQGAASSIRIVGLHELINDAWHIHLEAIKVLEQQEKDEAEDTEEDPPLLTLSDLEIDKFAAAKDQGVPPGTSIGNDASMA